MFQRIFRLFFVLSYIFLRLTLEYAAFPAFAQFDCGISLRKNDKYLSNVSLVGRLIPFSM